MESPRSRKHPIETELEGAGARAALPVASLGPGRTELLLAAVRAEERHLPFTDRVVLAGRAAAAGSARGTCPVFRLGEGVAGHVSRLSSARRTQAANCSPSARSLT